MLELFCTFVFIAQVIRSRYTKVTVTLTLSHVKNYCLRRRCVTTSTRILPDPCICSQISVHATKLAVNKTSSDLRNLQIMIAPLFISVPPYISKLLRLLESCNRSGCTIFSALSSSVTILFVVTFRSVILHRAIDFLPPCPSSVIVF